MYDELLLDPGLKCECGKRMKIGQTKDFECTLAVFKEDKEIPNKVEEFPIKHKLFKSIFICNACKTWYNGVGLVTDDIFRGVVGYEKGTLY